MTQDFSDRLRKISEAVRSKNETEGRLSSEFVEGWSKVKQRVLRPVLTKAEQEFDLGHGSLNCHEKGEVIGLSVLSPGPNRMRELTFRPDFPERNVKVVRIVGEDRAENEHELGALTETAVENEVVAFLSRALLD
jgi:hypothetical protein